MGAAEIVSRRRRRLKPPEFRASRLTSILTYFLMQSRIQRMKTSSPPPPAIDLATLLHHQLVYAFTHLLPPPPADTQEALHTRNLAVIARVAVLLPLDANEIDLAVQYVLAQAQAEDLLRLRHQHAGDIGLTTRLNAMHGSLVRTSLLVRAQLVKAQAERQKRAAIDGAANRDEWARYFAERSMLGALDEGAESRQAAWSEAVRTPCEDRTTQEDVP